MHGCQAIPSVGFTRACLHVEVGSKVKKNYLVISYGDKTNLSQQTNKPLQRQNNIKQAKLHRFTIHTENEQSITVCLPCFPPLSTALYIGCASILSNPALK